MTQDFRVWARRIDETGRLGSRANISERAFSALRRLGLKLDEVEAMTDSDLLALKGINRRVLAEIREGSQQKP